MSRPILIMIDADARDRARAARRSRARRFGEDFHVIGESSAAAGLAVLRDLADRHEPVARGRPTGQNVNGGRALGDHAWARIFVASLSNIG
jgi:hypothetical protein